MKLSDPYCFRLIIDHKEEFPKLLCKERNGVSLNFSSPLTKNHRPKIYIVKAEGEIIYIGYTSQSMSTRLSQGFRATGASGYHGYKWAKEFNEVELLVFVSDEEIVEENKTRITLFWEAVEAELVFRVRSNTGSWPAYQNEIHFNNDNREEVCEVAEEIYRKVK
jgi:predicted GIY-YIG superfamily endonuclease